MLSLCACVHVCVHECVYSVVCIVYSCLVTMICMLLRVDNSGVLTHDSTVNLS